MKDTRSELSERIDTIYEKLDSKKVNAVWLIVVIISLVWDWALCMDRVDKSFFGESGTIVAIAVVIWTFTMSFFCIFPRKSRSKVFWHSCDGHFYQGD